MKFLAVLHDSLREALDAKVIYATLGLSLLIIAVAATATFTPQPGGANLMQFAALPLNVDVAKLDLAELQRSGRGGPGGPDPTRIVRAVRGDYRVIQTTPAPNQEDAPGSDFAVVIEAGLSKVFAGHDAVRQEISERFGQLDDVQLAEVLGVERGEKSNRYVVTARLTGEGRKLWPHSFGLFFGALPVFSQGVPLGAQLYIVENVLLNQVGAWVVLLVGVILTAFFVPNMLRKGTVDLLVVKPMPRSVLLLYKYVGGLLFILINTTVAVGGVWLALAARSGIWAPGVLISIPAITFFFAILYSVSVLFGVVTRSAIVAILVTCATWFFLFLVGAPHTITEFFVKEMQAQARRNAARIATTTVGMLAAPANAPLLAAPVLEGQAKQLQPYDHSPGWFPPLVRAVHFFLPRTGDLTTLVDDRLQRDLMGLPRAFRAAAQKSEPVSWAESLTVSCVFIAVMLSLACWWFSTKDY